MNRGLIIIVKKKIMQNYQPVQSSSWILVRGGEGVTLRSKGTGLPPLWLVNWKVLAVPWVIEPMNQRNKLDKRRLLKIFLIFYKYLTHNINKELPVVWLGTSMSGCCSWRLWKCWEREPPGLSQYRTPE